MDNKKILVVEDEQSLNKIISKRLENAGYEVVSRFNGQEALEIIRKENFDVILMDIMMPKLSGTEVLSIMKLEKRETPVLFLTAKDSVADRVSGLDLGAHDYIVKPFSFDELLARIRMILRNYPQANTSILTFEDLTLDKKTHKVTRDGKEINLSAKEFDVLEYLMKYQGEVLPRERIESHVWDVDYCGLTNVIDVYIRYLRKKIDDDYEIKYIHTVRGVGYVLRKGTSIE